MKLVNMFLSVLFFVLCAPITGYSHDHEHDQMDSEIEESEAIKDRPEWQEILAEKYKLTPEEQEKLQKTAVPYPQQAMLVGLSRASGRPLDEVIKMRTEDKLGWGKIAKTLGVSPRDLGQSVAAMRHEIRDRHRDEHQKEQQDRRNEKAESRKEKIENKFEETKEKLERKMQEKKEKMDQKFEDKQTRREEKLHGRSDEKSKK